MNSAPVPLAGFLKHHATQTPNMEAKSGGQPPLPAATRARQDLSRTVIDAGERRPMSQVAGRSPLARLAAVSLALSAALIAPARAAHWEYYNGLISGQQEGYISDLSHSSYTGVDVAAGPPELALFAVGDIVNLPSLAGKLTQPADAVSAYLYGRLGSDAQAALAQYRGGPDAHVEQALITALNGIIQGDLIYDPNRFAQVTLCPEVQSMLTNSPPGPDLVRLNRLLLEDAYPWELSRNPVASVKSTATAQYTLDPFQPWIELRVAHDGEITLPCANDLHVWFDAEADGGIYQMGLAQTVTFDISQSGDTNSDCYANIGAIWPFKMNGLFYRLRPDAGEQVGDPVQVTVNSDLFFNLWYGTNYTSTAFDVGFARASAGLSGAFAVDPAILLNGATIWTTNSGAAPSGPVISGLQFNAAIGDVIGFTASIGVAIRATQFGLTDLLPLSDFPVEVGAIARFNLDLSAAPPPPPGSASPFQPCLPTRSGPSGWVFPPVPIVGASGLTQPFWFGVPLADGFDCSVSGPNVVGLSVFVTVLGGPPQPEPVDIWTISPNTGTCVLAALNWRPGPPYYFGTSVNRFLVTGFSRTGTGASTPVVAIGLLFANAGEARVVIKPQPVSLDARSVGQNLELSWPATALSFLLESSPSLDASAPWSAVTASPGTSGTLQKVSLPAGGPQAFFRLRKP